MRRLGGGCAIATATRSTWLARRVLGQPAMAKSNKHRESWVVPVVVFEWTVIFCGIMATIVVLMLH